MRLPGARTRDAAAGALSLRRWALRRLLRDDVDLPPVVPAADWSLFLNAERCAALLEESLRAAGQFENLDAIAAATLRAHATGEQRRALSLRAQLRQIAGIARDREWTVLVLKGGADVAAGRPFMVMDVDVLAPPAQAHALGAALDAAGYVPSGPQSRTHLESRRLAGGLSVEVHVAVSGFDAAEDVPLADSESLPGCEPLRRLAPQHHAWVVLCQAVHKHPERRIRIRDLVLLRETLDRCTPAQRDWLRDRVARDADASLHRAMLDRVGRGADTPDDLRAATRAYLIHARRRPFPPFSAPAVLQRLTLAVVAAGGLGPGRQLFRRRGGGLLRKGRRVATTAVAALVGAVMTADAPAVRRSRKLL